MSLSIRFRDLNRLIKVLTMFAGVGEQINYKTLKIIEFVKQNLIIKEMVGNVQLWTKSDCWDYDSRNPQTESMVAADDSQWCHVLKI